MIYLREKKPDTDWEWANEKTPLTVPRELGVEGFKF